MAVLETLEQAQTATAQPSESALRTLGGRADGSSFGAQVGAALGGLGDQIQRFAAMQAQDQATLSNFQTRKAFNDFASSEQARLEDARRQLGNGGKDFTKSYLGGQLVQPVDGSGAGGDTPIAPDGTPAVPSKETGNVADAKAATGGVNDGGFDGRAQAWLSANLEGASPQEKAQWQAQVSELRKTMAGQALQAEFGERDRFYKTTIGEQLDQRKIGIDTTPAGVDNYIKQGLDIIQGSGLSQADKESYAAAWKDSANIAYGFAQGRNDPVGTAIQLGSTGVGYYSKLGEAENNTGDPTKGNGGGKYQFEPGTWTSLVNSPEGEAAGLTAGGRQDAGQNEVAVRIFTKQNAAILQQSGIDPSEANLRMAHFLGAKGAVDFMQAMASNPGAPAAALFGKEAAANPTIFYGRSLGGGPDERTAPRTLAEVYALQTKGFTGAQVPTSVDPHLAALSYQSRENVLGYAERQARQQTAEADNAVQQQYHDWFNGFQTQLHDGTAGTPEINAARQSGQLTSITDIERAESLVRQREGDTAALANFSSMLNNNTPFNPFNADHKAAAEAGFRAAGGDTAAAVKVWDRTGILPDAAAVTMRGALVSQDPKDVGAAANLAGNMINKNPNAFAGVKNGSDLEAAGVKFNHLVNDVGLSPDDAAKRIQEESSPAYKSQMKVNQDDVKRFGDDIRKNGEAELQAAFTPRWSWNSVSLGVGAAAQKAVTQDYAELASDYYQRTGDADGAKAYAVAQMHKLYGVSNNALMKYPPEHVYPPDANGKYDYIYKQAAEDIRVHNNEKVDPKDIYLLPIPGLTENAWRAGGQTPYAVHYTSTVDGIPVQKVVMATNKPGQERPWAPDPAAMATDNKAVFDKTNAAVQRTQNEFENARAAREQTFGAQAMPVGPDYQPDAGQGIAAPSKPQPLAPPVATPKRQVQGSRIPVSMLKPPGSLPVTLHQGEQ